MFCATRAISHAVNNKLQVFDTDGLFDLACSLIFPFVRQLRRNLEWAPCMAIAVCDLASSILHYDCSKESMMQ